MRKLQSNSIILNHHITLYILSVELDVLYQNYR